MTHVNTGSAEPPRLAVYVNEWAMQELPRRPSAETWSFEQSLAKAADAGFEGCQAAPEQAAAVRAAGLRFCTSARISTPDEAEPTIATAAACTADCLTVHAGWGMETDAEADAIAEAILAAADAHSLPVFVETHRATMTQDAFRTTALLKHYPKMAINADFSHYYCGSEMTYRGFDQTRHDLAPILSKVGFIHGRVSDAQCMQCDLTDPKNADHIQNFATLWTDAMAQWQDRARPGDILIFAPELGPPSSGYSVVVRDQTGNAFEVCDRWEQSLVLRDLARQAFVSATARPR